MYYIYMLTNKYNNVLYTGVTNNLVKRVYQHRNKLVDGFTKTYNVDKLVYYETSEEILVAIEREKQIKGYKRQKKIDLINNFNANWDDLYESICL